MCGAQSNHMQLGVDLLSFRFDDVDQSANVSEYTLYCMKNLLFIYLKSLIIYTVVILRLV